MPLCKWYGLSVLLAAGMSAAGQNCKDNAVFEVHNENVEITKKQAAEYRPGLRDYYVQDFNDAENVYLKAAISKRRRDEWLARWQDRSIPKCMVPVLDELAVIAKKTLPSYRPTGFTVRNAVDEKVLRDGVNDIANATVLGGGFRPGPWKIETRGNGIPRARYKHGMLYLKYSTTDDGFCRMVHVNLVQDYSGGGTYGGSRPLFIKTEPVGCP
jgi:hypothetical protein